MTSTYWRFQRTGQSSFFIYDVYVPLLLITICWALALIAYLLRKNNKNALKSIETKYFTIMHKIHEVSILYVTMAMMMEWMYFDAGSGTRWISFIICLTFTIYFVSYELYIYYDMIKYP
jgi:membrane protein insertase Oxa1/YidC/SpoIIIJ